MIDPREIELAKYADHFLQLRPGTNVALLNMMLYYIIEEDLADNAFIETRTEGYDDFVANIKKLDINAMESITGVAREEVRAAAIYLRISTERYVLPWAWRNRAFTGNIYGTANCRPRNDHWKHWPKRSWCVNPLRGQNNVQGAADMGAQPHQGAGYMDITNPAMNRLYMDFYKGVDIPLGNWIENP